MTSTKNPFDFEQVDSNSGVDPTLLFEEINKELEEYLLEKSIDTDSTDRVLNFLETISNQVQENFDGLIDEDPNKERFIRALTQIFVLLLNTKLDTVEKILKIAIETMLKIWQGLN